MNSLRINLTYQIAYRILTVITPLITSPIITRAFGAEKLGIYSATQAFAEYFAFFAMLGIAKYGQRTIAAAENNVVRQQLFWEIYSVQFVSSLVSIVAYLLSIQYVDSARTQIALIQSLLVFACLVDISWFYFGIEEFKITAIRNFAIKIITVMSIVMFIHDSNDLSLYAFIMGGGTVATQLVLWVSLPKQIHFERVRWAGVKRHIGPIFKLFVPVIALSVYHIMDKTMLDVLSTEAEVGYYYAVDKIVYIPFGLITAIGTVMLTRVSYTIHNDSMDNVNALLSKSVELTMFLACATTFGIAAICEEFIPLFFGAGYEPCIKLMYMMLPVLLIKSLGDIVRSQYLIAARKDEIYIAAVISGAVTNVICNILLIPGMGAMGAVLGTLAAEFVVFVIQVMGCRREVRFISCFIHESPYIAIGVLMFFFVRVIANILEVEYLIIQIIAMVFAGAALYMILSIFLWLFRKSSAFHAAATKYARINGGK